MLQLFKKILLKRIVGMELTGLVPITKCTRRENAISPGSTTMPDIEWAFRNLF